MTALLVNREFNLFIEGKKWELNMCLICTACLDYLAKIIELNWGLLRSFQLNRLAVRI